MTRILLRRGTAAEWASVNPVLFQGEPGVEVDTDKFKIGDGHTAWNSLRYASTGDVTSVDGHIGAVDLSTSYQPLDPDLTAVAAVTTSAYGRSLLSLIDAAAGRSSLGLGTASLSAATDFQPSDSDLTAIASLSTTSFGRGLLALADAAALRSAAALGTAATHADTDYVAASTRGAAGGVATLDNAGLIPTSQLPPLAINEVFVVGSQAAMLALSAQRGDVARRTDLTPNKLFLLTADDSSQLVNWLDISTTDLVSSVDGMTGAVDLSTSYQPVDSDLTAIAALSTTSFGRSLLTQVDAAAVKSLLGLTVGSNVQAWDADLDSLAAGGATATSWLRALLDTVYDVNGAASTVQGLAALRGNNLSDLASVSSARTNLGLGSAAVADTSAFDAAGVASSAANAVKAGAMGVVLHGAVAGTARPSGFGAIHWVGSVTPTNAVDGDVWTNTA